MEDHMLGRTFVLASITFCLPGSIRADDRSEMLAIIDKSVTAQGGEEKISNIKDLVVKTRGQTEALGVIVKCEQTSFIQLPDKRREDLVIAVENKSVVAVGEKAWTIIDGKAQDLTEEELRPLRIRLHAFQVMRLVSLKDKSFELA